MAFPNRATIMFIIARRAYAFAFRVRVSRFARNSTYLTYFLRVFFSLRAATTPSRISAAATAALRENFGRGATFERDFSFGFDSSEKTEGTLPEELDRAEAIPGVRATSK